MTSSPCTKVCKIKEGVCTGCHRTLEQIGAWGSMTDKERQEAMAKMGYTRPASADVPEKWRTVMKELADDLESEVEARRSGDLDRRIERDLIVVKEARVLLDEQEQGDE
jgi:predicted Fe-S protein YdhL (DUF1289 family)